LVQQQEAQAKQATDAQADASAALAQAEKEAAAILQEAQAKAARMVQQQEAQAKQDAEAAKQQVCILYMLNCSCCIICLAAEAHHLERSHIRGLSCNIPIKGYPTLVVLHALHPAVTSATLHSSISITGLLHKISRIHLIIDIY